MDICQGDTATDWMFAKFFPEVDSVCNHLTFVIQEWYFETSIDLRRKLRVSVSSTVIVEIC